MSWANVVTLGRIALIPLFVYFMYASSRGAATSNETQPIGAWIAFAVFAAAALTDSLDGYLARRQGKITSLGQFLDPLADKLLIGTALVTLVILRSFPLWAAVVIVIREVAVSVLRSIALRRGVAMPASVLGKLKTAVQVPTVLLWLLPLSGVLSGARNIVVYLAVGLTVISGAQYFLNAKNRLRAPESSAT